MTNLDEAKMVFEWVARVNRAVTQSYLQAKTGLKVLSAGKGFDQIVTQADIGVSKALLDGGVEGIQGFRSLYPGSFSEEQDSPERLGALEIIELDPIDGTGDFFNTYQTPRVISPTTLVTKLVRANTNSPFQPVWGIIFEVVHGFGILSDGAEILLLVVDSSGQVFEVPHERMQYEWKSGDPVFINRRICYPQLTFHGPFMSFLRNNGLHLHLVTSGGCGITQLQLFRNFIEPDGPGAEAFAEIQPLSVSMFAQPDTKTWDLDPAEVIADVLGLPRRTDIFGNDLSGNAAAPTTAGMLRVSGQILSASPILQESLRELTVRFSQRNPDCPILATNYEFKDAIETTLLGK